MDHAHAAVSVKLEEALTNLPFFFKACFLNKRFPGRFPVAFRKSTLCFVGAFLALCLIVGCGGESQESLFETAQFEERQTNVVHAGELYQRIMQEHPDSEWAKKAKARLEQLDQLIVP